MKFHSINPHNRELVQEFETADDLLIEKALQGAKDAHRASRQISIEEKAMAVRAIATALNRNKNKYATLMAEEMGKPLAQGRAEVEKCAWLCEYYAEKAEPLLESQQINIENDVRAWVQYQPLGVVLGIMPWNFPFWQVFRCAVPSIMAGNSFILKHAPNVPRCSLEIEKLFHQTSLPENIFCQVFASLEQTEGLVKKTDAVSLTGSTRAGRAVAATAGAALKKVVLELGGSDPFIILRDADLNLAVETAVNSRLLNSGQSCIAAKRFIVAAEKHDEFRQLLVEKLKSVKVGDPLNEENTVGPLARRDLVEAAQGQLERSKKAGAKVAYQANVPSSGFYYPPVLLDGIQESMACWSEETFSPTFVSMPARDEHQAVEMANATPYGLGASIFSKDHERAAHLADQVEAGNVFINEMVKSDPRLPFGGIKDSGFGRELAENGIKEFVNTKTVYVKY